MMKEILTRPAPEVLWRAFHGVRFRTLSWLGIVLACACLVPARGHSQTLPEKKAHYSGRLRLDYDYRSQGDASDADFFGYLNVGGRDLGNGHLDFYMSERFHSDLDGDPSDASDPDSAYQSLDDAEGVIEDRIFQAYLDFHDQKGDKRLRLGRQTIDVADYLTLDGGQVILFEHGDLGGRAYFGQPVSYYSSVSSDTAGGVSLVGRPWTGNRMRLTYAQYHDESEGETDQNVFFDSWQQVEDAFRTRLRISVLNDDFRMAMLDLSYFAPDGVTDLRVGGSRWGEFDARTRAYSPLFFQLGKQQPYTRLYARLNRALGSMFAISPGVSVRMSEGSEDVYTNRDYRDYDLTLSFEPDRAFSSSLSLQYWDVDGDEKFLALTGDVRYRHHRIWEISAGAAYMHYDYHSYSEADLSLSGGQTIFYEDGTVTEESPYTLTYLLRAKWNITRHLALRLQGDIEDDDASHDLSYRGRASVEVRF